MRNVSGNQDAMEFSKFLRFVKQKNIKRYCELGCRNGDTFFWVARTIGPDGTFIAVDLPENDNSKEKLVETVRELQHDYRYRNSYVLHGNSHDAMTISWVRERGPYDLILVDADHRYSGVTRDFVCYQNMTKYIAFHDIDAPDDHMSDGYVNGVGQFWREVKKEYKPVAEIINAGSQMGFGILECARKL